MPKEQEKPMTKKEKIIAVAFWVFLVWLGIETGWLQGFVIDLAADSYEFATSDGGKFCASVIVGFVIIAIGDKINPNLGGGFYLCVISGLTALAWLIGWIENSFWLFVIFGSVAFFALAHWYERLKKQWIEVGRQEERDRHL